MKPVVVVGAGVGGLVTAAALSRVGLSVELLDAHVYPGGCAGTFYHQGYRFDAGATLAGGFAPGGPMEQVAEALRIPAWPARPEDPAMQVYLPGGQVINRWSDPARWAEERRALDPSSEAFWAWQEDTAAVMWRLALRLPPWPPQSAADLARLARLAGHLSRSEPGRSLSLARDALRPVHHHLGSVREATRLLVDAQLLISAQTTSAHANALYAAAALDLPRRGVVQFQSGMGTLAETLAQAFTRLGGNLRYRQRVTAVRPLPGGGYRVTTAKGLELEASAVVFNLPDANIAAILANHAAGGAEGISNAPGDDAWSAFCLYLGVDDQAIPVDAPLHHQVVLRQPMGEGNTAFLSISPSWDGDRAPAGRRAITISTHTLPGPWWALEAQDPQALEFRRQAYTEKLLEAAEIVLPKLRSHVRLALPATPITFQRFTLRQAGWVGGFPQTHLLRARPTRIRRRLYRVGDSIFPGQSTAAVALGGLRVAADILQDCAAEFSVARPAFDARQAGCA